MDDGGGTKGSERGVAHWHGIAVADLRKMAQVTNVLGHPVYITELKINLCVCDMKIIGNKKDVLDI